MMDTQNNYQTQLLSTEIDDFGSPFAISWSPNGQRLLVTEGNPYRGDNDDFPVYELSLTDTQAERLPVTYLMDIPPSTTIFSRWSDDSRYMTTTFLPVPSDEVNTYIYDFEAGELCELVLPSTLTTYNAMNAMRWSENDQKWVIVSTTFRFYWLDPDTCELSDPVAAPVLFYTRHVSWSEDRSQLVVSREDVLYLLDTQGNIVRQLIDVNANIQIIE